MASYPIAVLKFSWADTPYTNDTPNNLTYSDVISRLFFPSVILLVPMGVLIGAAVWYRRRPAVHKRLMMLAILTSTAAPIAHLVGHWEVLRPYPVINPISGLLLLSLLAIHTECRSVASTPCRHGAR